MEIEYELFELSP